MIFMNRLKVKAFCLIVICTAVCASGCQPSQYSYNRLVWSDEFKGDSLDPGKWRAMTGTGPAEGYPERWGNSEEQYYRAENAHIRDGNLVISIRREDFGGMEYTSARITTSGLYAFTYGRIEARMKFPSGADGIWPAFWLLPDGLPSEWEYGAWAASGEVDIVEARSRLPGKISGAAHFGGQWPANDHVSGKHEFPEGESISDWNTYEKWSLNPDRDIVSRASQRVKEILDSAPTLLSHDTIGDLDRFIARYS